MSEFADGPPVEERIGDVLTDADASVAVAESCTGGLIGSLLTDVPGSSEYFDRSLVTYSYDAKLTTLAVPRETLDEHGAVSEPVARSMARAVRDVSDTEWGVATTGIAGPSGGSPEKPVGTVFIGLSVGGEWGTNTSETTVRRYEFDGDRRAVKEQIARRALADLEAAVERQE